MSLPKILQRLTEIYEKYGKEHPDKLYEFIDKDLPVRMNLHLQRELRREQLEQKSEYYIHNFLYTHLCYRLLFMHRFICLYNPNLLYNYSMIRCSQ